MLPRTIHPLPRCPKPAQKSRLSKLAYYCQCVFRRRRRNTTNTRSTVWLLGCHLQPYWWAGIRIPQNLHLCPMFTKRWTRNYVSGFYFTADFIYFLGRIATGSVLAKTKSNVIVSAKSKQKRRSWPTRRVKTLGINEDFEVLLSRTAYTRVISLRHILSWNCQLCTFSHYLPPVILLFPIDLYL